MASDLSIALSRLHLLLKQQEEVETTLSQGPRRIAVAEKSLQAAKDAVEQQKAEIKARRKATDEIQLKLRTKEAELLKLQGMLNQASSNKEYAIVKSQSETGSGEKLSMEDAALAAMDQVDAAQRRLKDLEAAVKQSEQQLAAIRSEVTSSETGLKTEQARLLHEVTTAEKAIDWGQHASAYLRLRAARLSGALAAIEDKFCTACNNSVTSQDIVRINTGSLQACRECGRIIYIVGEKITGGNHEVESDD
jgi:predicted  nucleic acid-binding Zn-ribbon protein